MVFFSSIGSAISSGFSAAVSVVSTTLSSIGKFAVEIAPKIAGQLGTVGLVIQAIATIVGLFNADEKVEEMGDRAMQASESGIRPENFDSFDEYMDSIRDFDLDPEKSKSYSSEAKKIAGIGIACKGIEDKFQLQSGAMGAMTVLVASNPDYFNSERVSNWLQTGVDIANVVGYFDKKLSAGENVDIIDDMVKAEQNISDNSDQETYTEILNTKDELYQSIEKDNN
ncbi:hypothetical protein [Psychrobacter celer]|uniref:hypothetical protein n=1 Tax=Psychrobacter celer TaxID=306572 RepID=UPI0018DF6A47|nr:hypothetical protein [Psychrobacter celer]